MEKLMSLPLQNPQWKKSLEQCLIKCRNPIIKYYNMTKSISLIAFLCLLISCVQNPKAGEEKLTVSPIDTLQNNPTETTQVNLDGIEVSPKNFKILLENEFVRIVEYSLKPGEKDNWHTHPPKSGYVVSGGTLKIYPEKGEAFVSDEKVGNTFWSDYVGKHYDENIGNTTVTIVLTEIKSLQ
jgi:quercetin dioxygenase-like cupin family protein